MGSDPMIFIRTDSNEEISAGHIYRCFSIAEALLPDRRVCFLVSCPQSVRLLEQLFTPETSCDVCMLRTGNLKEPEQELEELAGILQEAGDCVLLVDSYFVTHRYLEFLRSRTRLAYLDDLQMFPYPVDLVINYDIIPDSQIARYQQFYRCASKALLGGDYAPLRKQFYCPPYRQEFDFSQPNGQELVSSQPDRQELDFSQLDGQGIDFSRSDDPPSLRLDTRHILLTTGGSDPFSFSEDLLKTLPLHLPREIHYHVVAGRYYEDTNKNTLRHLCERSEVFHYYEDVRDMASLMKRCDLAVCAAGTTLYELCALGIPAVCFTMADNQLAAASAFAAAKAVVWAGDLRDSDESARNGNLRDSGESTRNGNLQDSSESPPDGDLRASASDLHNPVLRNILAFLQEMTAQPQLRREAGKRMHRLVDGQGALRIARELIRLADQTTP